MRFVVLRILKYCVAPERCLSVDKRRRRTSSVHVKMLGERGVHSIVMISFTSYITYIHPLSKYNIIIYSVNICTLLEYILP